MRDSYADSEILLVEDNPAEAALAIRAFEKNQISNPIHLAADGEQALDFIFGRGKFKGQNLIQKLELILLDINIPIINGLEVLKILKSERLLKNIPVVMLTTSEEESDIRRAYEYGANSYLIKPQGFHEFIDEIGILGTYWLTLNKTVVKLD